MLHGLNENYVPSLTRETGLEPDIQLAVNMGLH